MVKKMHHARIISISRYKNRIVCECEKKNLTRLKVSYLLRIFFSNMFKMLRVHFKSQRCPNRHHIVQFKEKFYDTNNKTRHRHANVQFIP